MNQPLVHFRDCGQIAYQDAWDLQESLLAAGVAAKSAAELPQNHLLFCEHPHVYTLGKSGKPEHILIDEARREALGIAYFRINRGGDITYHGPGQITGYPIFDLEQFKPDIHLYLRNMEEAIIQYLATLGLRAGRSAGETGVWLHLDTDYPKKICAIGVRLSRWITMHGFAFNVNTDLSYFSHIIPCGITDKGVTSLQAELGYPLDFEKVKKAVAAHFAAQFGFIIA
jgi:lipoyl(octanoyl) transferase